jgi:hypothetical protein
MTRKPRQRSEYANNRLLEERRAKSHMRSGDPVAKYSWHAVAIPKTRGETVYQCRCMEALTPLENARDRPVLYVCVNCAQERAIAAAAALLVRAENSDDFGKEMIALCDAVSAVDAIGYREPFLPTPDDLDDEESAA